MTSDRRLKRRSPLQSFALEHEVDEALHKLLPCYERILRRRFNLSPIQSSTAVTGTKPPPREVAALRALRRLAVAERHR